MNSNNIHAPAALAGVVTQIVVTLSGNFTGAIDTYGAGSDQARLILRLGKVHMTFTSAEQVQHLRGYVAMAKDGMRAAQALATLPVVESDESEAATVAAITWSKTPHGVFEIEELYIPRLRRPVSYVALTVGPVTFRILDRIALGCAMELLGRAHKIAVTAFPDGRAWRENPTNASWHPSRKVRVEREGSGWIPRR